jgi:Zn-dependent M28 family amino/carboxypeptidase
MDVEYHVWNNATNPNVIGEIPGLVNPEDIFIIGGHIDDVQFTPGGADDNASGSVAAMVAADILSQYQWGCTLRFAVWTGEEQGLWECEYASGLSSRERTSSVTSLDMIAWNTINSQIRFISYVRGAAFSRSGALFADVVIIQHRSPPVIGTAFRLQRPWIILTI